MQFRLTLIMTLLFFSFQVISGGCTAKQKQDNINAGNNFVVKTVADTIVLSSPSEMGNFVLASRLATPTVVHIKTIYNSAGSVSPLDRLYGIPSRGSVPSMGSGSGVTISTDGYIATNNHVVENASSIEVIFPNRQSYAAELVGRDPNTDLALLKVDATGLDAIEFGNSDAIQIGEWVLAVGYPLSLNTTVTAGIISAKGRSIGIINRRTRNGGPNGNAETNANTAIESFLQTDAAINPGNSGGALVNTKGELVGINTAIASQTGSYAGYAFAIPVNLVKKILDDLRKYGSVKRGILGVSFPSPAAESQYLTQQGINPASVDGVYIIGVQNGSAAAAAGLKEGDIIQSIDGIPLNSSSVFSEWIARHRPGDVIQLTYLRDGNTETTAVTLKAEEPPNAVAKSAESLEEIYNKLGATFAHIPEVLKKRYNLNSGVLVTNVLRGGFFDQIGIPRGTIIAFINGKEINNPQDIDEALLSAQRGLIQILAIAPDGSKVVFNFSLGT